MNTVIVKLYSYLRVHIIKQNIIFLCNINLYNVLAEAVTLSFKKPQNRLIVRDLKVNKNESVGRQISSDDPRKIRLPQRAGRIFKKYGKCTYRCIYKLKERL